jgi:cell division protein FtsB
LLGGFVLRFGNGLKAKIRNSSNLGSLFDRFFEKEEESIFAVLSDFYRENRRPDINPDYLVSETKDLYKEKAGIILNDKEASLASYRVLSSLIKNEKEQIDSLKNSNTRKERDKLTKAISRVKMDYSNSERLKDSYNLSGFDGIGLEAVTVIFEDSRVLDLVSSNADDAEKFRIEDDDFEKLKKLGNRNKEIFEEVKRLEGSLPAKNYRKRNI